MGFNLAFKGLRYWYERCEFCWFMMLIIIAQFSVQNHKIVDFSVYLLSVTEIVNKVFIVGK